MCRLHQWWAVSLLCVGLCLEHAGVVVSSPATPAISATRGTKHEHGSPVKHDPPSSDGQHRMGLESPTSPTTTSLPYQVTTSDELPSNSTAQARYLVDEHQSELYTVQMNHHSQRQMKHDDTNMVYDYKCPQQHYIHPCDCLELDKRAEMFEGSGDMPELTANATPTVEMIEEEPIHPDLIETVAFCKNIRNVQVLTEAIRGFQGHRINYFVLDGCKLPPFPNNTTLSERMFDFYIFSL